MRNRNHWIIGCLFLACCSGASSAVEDAGQLLVDAGEVIADAGEMIADAGAELADSGQAHAAFDIPCDIVFERTQSGITFSDWYAETTVEADAMIDAWLCDTENFGAESPGCVPENGCTGDAPPKPLACTQTHVQMEGSKVRAWCGWRRVSVDDGETSGSRAQTLRLQVR